MTCFTQGSGDVIRLTRKCIKESGSSVCLKESAILINDSLIVFFTSGIVSWNTKKLNSYKFSYYED